MRTRIENIKLRIAQPYIADAVQKTTTHLANYFAGTRQLDGERIIKALDSIKYPKAWPEGTTLDQAFDLAIHEAIAIVRTEMK
jgi:hypothetical protein